MIKTRVVNHLAAQRNWNFNFGPPARRKRWLERRRRLRQKEKKQGSIIEVIPDKTAGAVKKGLAITNIKF